MSEEFQRIKVQSRRDSLYRPQRQISLSPLDAAHVGAMNANQLGQLLLAQPTDPPIRLQVPSDSALQVAFHLLRDAAVALLIDLQTYE